MKVKRPSRWLLEFRAFLLAEEVPPPSALTHAICAEIARELHPPWRAVAVRLFCLHVLAALVVAIFCPQLGVGPLVGGHGLMHFFMAFGPLACSALCGATFLGTSALFATLLLTREELRVASRYGFVNATLLVGFSFAALMLVGGEGDQGTYLFWIVGAISAGFLGLRLGGRLRAPAVTLH